MIDHYILPLLFACTLIAASVVLGYIWNRLAALFFKHTQQAGIFWNYFTGLFTGVSFFAIYLTKGITLLLFCPLLLLVLQRYLPASAERKDRAKDLVFIFAAAIIQYALFVYMFLPSNESVLRFVGGDFNIYFRAAERLSRTGVEAYNFSIDTKGYSLPTLYHFGDIWIYALSARINHFQPTHTFLTAFTLLGTLFSLGLSGFIKMLFPARSGNAVYYLLILAGSFSSFAFCMPGFIARVAEPYTLAVFNWGKVMVLSCCMIATLSLVKLEQLKGVLIVIGITGLLYINAFPAFFGAYVLLLLVYLLQRKSKLPVLIMNIAVLLLIMIVPVTIQYKVFPTLFQLHDNADPIQKISPFAALHVARYLKTALNIFIGGWLQLFTIIPYLLLLIAGLLFAGFFKEFRLKNLLGKIDMSYWFLFFLFLAGLSSWALTFPLQVDTVQFFHNILAPVYCIFISIVLYYLVLVVRKPVLSLLMIGITLFSVAQSSAHPFFVSEFSRKDWEKLKLFLQEDGPESGSFICSDTKATLSNAFFRKSDQYVPLNILIYKFPAYQNVSLVSPFLSLNRDDFYYHEASADLQLSSLGRYMTMNKGIDTQAIIQRFIAAHSFRYYSVSRDTAAPLFLRPLMADSCELESARTVVYRLKANPDNE